MSESELNKQNTEAGAAASIDDDDFIPDESSVTTHEGIETWRFAEGKIVTGREETGTLREKVRLVGRLQRLGIHRGTNKDTGALYVQLEIDLRTAQGNCRAKVPLSDKAGVYPKPSVQTLNFAEGVLEIKPNGLLAITAHQGKKPNAYGKFPTYVNFHHVAPNGDSTPVKRRAFDANNRPDMAGQWLELEKEIRAHPAYAERPATEDAAPSHLGELTKESAAKGWPTPEQKPAAWLGMLHGFLKKSGDVWPTLAGPSDDEWGELRQVLKDRPDCPKALAAPVETNAAAIE